MGSRGDEKTKGEKEKREVEKVSTVCREVKGREDYVPGGLLLISILHVPKLLLIVPQTVLSSYRST